MIRENKNYCFLTFGDGNFHLLINVIQIKYLIKLFIYIDLLTKILPKAVQKEEDIKLAPHFFQYFDILLEFKKHLPHAVQLYTLTEMLAYTNLKVKENSFEPYAQSTCKSVVRLLNMLITGGHIF